MFTKWSKECITNKWNGMDDPIIRTLEHVKK